MKKLRFTLKNYLYDWAWHSGEFDKETLAVLMGGMEQFIVFCRDKDKNQVSDFEAFRESCRRTIRLNLGRFADALGYSLVRAECERIVKSADKEAQFITEILALTARQFADEAAMEREREIERGAKGNKISKPSWSLGFLNPLTF